MRRSINLTQREVDEHADRATALNAWLEEKVTLITSNINIPPELTAVAPVVIVSGVFIFAATTDPGAACWGGCFSP
jgi:hypothetical protein